MGVMGPGERKRIEEEVEERERAGWPPEVAVEFGVHIEEASRSLDHGVLVEAGQGGYTVHVEGMSKASAVLALRAAVDHLDPPEPSVVEQVFDGIEEAERDREELSDPEQQQLGPFARDSETSRQAALATYPRQGSQRWAILTHVHGAEQATPPGRPRGLTREELAEDLGLSGDTIRPRVVELVEGGWLEESEFTRRTRAGNDASLVMLTEKARKRLVEAPSG